MRFIKRIYGRKTESSTCYLTRIKLTPKTRWGQLYLHVFHRADDDRAFHDHPFDFWTFPFMTYREDVLRSPKIPMGQHTNVVQRFKWHFRPAEYTHIVKGWPDSRRKNLVTLVWRKASRREWGFWTHVRWPGSIYRWSWVPWKEYLSS